MNSERANEKETCAIPPDIADEIERDCTSRYFLLGGVTPVRVLCRKADGLKAGAIAPDPESGELAFRNDLLSRLERSAEVEEIDAAAFVSHWTAFREGRTRSQEPGPSG